MDTHRAFLLSSSSSSLFQEGNEAHAHSQTAIEIGVVKSFIQILVILPTNCVKQLQSNPLHTERCVYTHYHFIDDNSKILLRKSAIRILIVQIARHNTHSNEQCIHHRYYCYYSGGKDVDDEEEGETEVVKK